jgi:hypothetical protein
VYFSRFTDFVCFSLLPGINLDPKQKNPKNMKRMITSRIFLSIMILACHNGFGQEPVVVKPDGTFLLTREAKTAFIDNASKLLNDNYVFPEVAKQVGEYLKARLSGGAYDTIMTVGPFIEVMTEEMQSVSHDKHMRVTMTPPPAVKSAEDNPALESILRQKESAQRNYGFIKVENLKGNVGYIDLRGFVPVAMGRETATAAMKLMFHSISLPAIIPFREERNSVTTCRPVSGQPSSGR